MSKSIKVSQENYLKLRGLLRPLETYNDVVTRLIASHEKAWELLSVIEGSLKFQSNQQGRLDAIHRATLDRRDIEARIIKSD